MHHEKNHKFLMFRITFRNQECQSYKRIVIDFSLAALAVQMAIHREKQDKHKRPNSLIPIGKWMISLIEKEI